MYSLSKIAQKFKSTSNFQDNLSVFENISMAERTSFKIGGITPLLVEPHTEDALLFCLNVCIENGVKFFVLGGGTNVLFPDEGFNGVVISTLGLRGITATPNTVCSIRANGEQSTHCNVTNTVGNTRADCIQTDATSNPRAQSTVQNENALQNRVILRALSGTTINALVKFCAENALTGIEAFSGLPGTIGGAAFMNARCFDLEMSEVAVAAGVVDYSTQKVVQKHITFSTKDWAYKSSRFMGQKQVITYVDVIVKKATQEEKVKILQKCNQIMKARIEKGHFKLPCAGSVFKNNRAFGEPTGKIIDSLGLKGFQIGGAQVSEWHGNIIVNKNNATAKDVRALCDYIIQTVKEKKGFTLEPEIVFVEN